MRFTMISFAKNIMTITFDGFSLRRFQLYAEYDD